jgi:hypothetical protein
MIKKNKGVELSPEEIYLFKNIKLGKLELNSWAFILVMFFGILTSVIHYSLIAK